MDIVLTDKQKEGLEIALQRYRNKEKYTVISGYAGTGKSTLVKVIIEELLDENTNLDYMDICYAAYTGKAAEVLRRKGNDGAMTLHKLLYDFIPKAEGGFIKKKKDKLECKIVVVDEVSMAPKVFMDLLFLHDVYVICLGDPFQLPPIDKDQDNHLLDNPHIFLDKVMRQAEESEIIRLTMDIRNGKPISYRQGKDVLIMSYQELSLNILNWGDQVICATNKRRKSVNDQMRNFLGYSGDPQHLEKIICLRNYWDYIDNDGNALVNGTTGYLMNPVFEECKLPTYLKIPNFTYMKADFQTDIDTTFSELKIDKNKIITGAKTLDWKTEWKISNLKNKKYKESIPLDFEYGYCITGHKSQGSEWDKVIVLEESFPFDKEEHARWLYTTATRAADKLVIVR